MSPEVRYRRQAILEEFSGNAMSILASSSVLVVGVGGLGCPILVSLLSAGVGNIAFIDDDIVEESNLSRQWLFNQADIGLPKVVAADLALKRKNEKTNLIPIYDRIHQENVQAIIGQYDLIIDATDNFQVRYLLNDFCFLLKKPLVFGAIFKFQAQVAVFNSDQKLVNLRDVYPMMPDPVLMPSCEATGVLVTATSIVGNMQAQEAIFALLGKSRITDCMVVVDLNSWSIDVVKIAPNPSNPLRKVELKKGHFENISQICGSTNSINWLMMNEVSVSQLKLMMDQEESFWLVDVREKDEFDICSIGGELIPLSQIGERWSEIPSQGKVVVFCRSGIRSANVIRFLQEQQGYTNLLNLQGGILAWIDQIDNTLQRY